MSIGYRVDVKTEGMLAKYLASIKDIDKWVTNVGFIDGATYKTGQKVAYIAYLNEYGQHNPPRPFLKRTMEKNYNAWTKLITVKIWSKGLNEDSVREALKAVGVMAVGDVHRTIAEWPHDDPRMNKPATIRAKARKSEGKGGKNQVANDPTRVLHDTGRMMNSVRYEVVTK